MVLCVSANAVGALSVRIRKELLLTVAALARHPQLWILSTLVAAIFAVFIF